MVLFNFCMVIGGVRGLLVFVRCIALRSSRGCCRINEWDRGQIFEITSCIGLDDLAFFFGVDKCDDEIVAVIEGALNLLTRCR